MANTRACGMCKHLDSRVTATGKAQCWFYYKLQRPDDVVVDCTTAERADGKAPPGQIRFAGERIG